MRGLSSRRGIGLGLIAFGAAFVFGLAACGNSATVGTGETADASAADGSTVTRTFAWTGQTINVQSDGAQTSVYGGIDVDIAPDATEVSATAEFRWPLKPTPEGGNVEAVGEGDPPGSLTVEEEDGTVFIRCKNAPTAGAGGCNKIKVVVPPGTSTTPLHLALKSGNGTVTVNGRKAILGSLAIDSAGDVAATVPATEGASIRVTTRNADDIVLKLPTSFAADSIVLEADTDKIDTRAFPDVASGSGRGTAGRGAKLIALTSREFAGSTGGIVLDTD